MSAISVPAAASILSLVLVATALPAQTSVSDPSSSGMSKVRIVRLSEVRGEVQVDRGTGRGFEAAMQNLPIVESSHVRTGVGVAEIEFEDNSTLRLAPDTEVEFPMLERRASGATVTAARVLRGTVYASLIKTRTANNDFTLLFGPEKLPLQPDSHIRLEMNPTGARLAVLDGMVEVNGADGPTAVPRKRTITFAFAPNSQPEVSEVKKEVASNSLDSWDKQSADYHARVATMAAVGNAPYSYGLNDMNYYGSFTDQGGCGMMWRPYFTSAAWEPYANGTWAWYPGAGYSWVSPYPWGWTPYHYGSWSYCPGTGWGWMPGGVWNGLANVPGTTGTTFGTVGHFPHRPTEPPRVGQSTLVSVNLKPLISSEVSGQDSFLFRRDSAGLGIPREGLGGLRGFSENALRHGTASTPVYLTVASGAGTFSGAGRTTVSGLAPVAVHRGYAPAPAMPTGSGFSANSSSLSSQGASSTQSIISPGPVSSGGGIGGGHGGGAAPVGGGGGGHGH